MRPPRISHLGLAFVGLAAGLILGLGAYMLHRLDDITAAVQQRERETGEQEIVDALGSLDHAIRNTARRVAAWDETRQQLVFDEYYTLWRDVRVHDAGYLPESVDDVALYDGDRQILRPSAVEDSMPETVPYPGPVFVVTADHDGPEAHAHVCFYRPVYADPSGETVMGYLGINFDLLQELAENYRFRFAEVDRIEIGRDKLSLSDLTGLIGNIRYQPRPNPSLLQVRQVFETELLHLLLAVVVFLGLAAFVLHRVLVRPLREISGEIDALQTTADPGADPSPTVDSPMPVAELELVRRSFHNYRKRLAELHGNLQQSSRDFYEQARSDALTGTYNRRAMEEDWLYPASESPDDPSFALMLFDCDHFKAINDTYGHDAGDSVIKAIARCLQESLRRGDRLYRIGGDEFATFLPATGEETARQIAERCLHQVREHDFRQYGLSEPVSISIGVAVSAPGRETASLSELQKRADLAMYEAKRPGNRKIVFYDKGMGDVASLVASRPLNAVFNAIRDPLQIEMHYQRVVHLPSRISDYAEALVRIRLDEQLLLPGEIFPIVHTRRLDTEFDLAVVQAVTRDLSEGRLTRDQGVSINVSAPGIVHAGVVAALIELRKAEPDRKIVIEITETALITQMGTASDHVRELRDNGFLVALDDFGSGYSSLRYLSSMPVDIVKFDISMVRFLEHEQAHQRAITEDIAGIVKAAGYQTVAEGIENQSLLDKVTAVGFDYAQGYFLDTP